MNVIRPAAAIMKLKALAKARWGDIPISAEVTMWEDGDYQASVFHTFYSSLDEDEPTGRVKISYRPGDDEIIERVISVDSTMKVGEVYRKEKL